MSKRNGDIIEIDGPDHVTGNMYCHAHERWRGLFEECDTFKSRVPMVRRSISPSLSKGTKLERAPS